MALEIFKENEFVSKNLPKKKISGLDGFTGIFMRKTTILYKLFQKTEESVTLSFTL